ncbi:MAG: RNA polymerase sigma factor [Nannocystaceae bacterium]
MEEIDLAAAATTTMSCLPKYSALYRSVRTVLYTRGLHRADVDDIAQTVMEKILRASANGKGPSSNARAWVKRIAFNEHINWIRRRGRKRECTFDTEREVGPAAPITTDRSHCGSTVVFLRDVEGQLTDRQRAVARMFSSGYTGQEIANTLGLSPALISLEKKTIRQTLHDMGYARRPRRSRA